MDAEFKEKYFRDLRAKIAEHGFATISVNGEGESFSYTVGLHKNYGHPEMIIFGLPPNLSHGILSDVAQKAKEGMPLDLTKPADQLLVECDVIFVNVPEEKYADYLLSAVWFNEEEGFPVYQIVWPSARDGLYPWDPEAAPEFVAAQPILGEKPE